tara:strand:+ start:368 stop:817 length:450 start_codon:yes stop_codon:yes gene_type:complete
MTTIIFPILTCALILILGICIGIYISSQLEKKIDKSIKEVSNKYFTYTDQNGNVLKYPIQNNTMTKNISLKEFQSLKIKLNKYELDYLIKNIEDHLNKVGETYQENEHIQELFANLITKNKENASRKPKTIGQHSKVKRKRKKKDQSKS